MPHTGHDSCILYTTLILRRDSGWTFVPLASIASTHRNPKTCRYSCEIRVI